MALVENNKVPDIRKAMEETESTEVEERHFEAVIDGGAELKKQSGIGKFFRQLFADDLSAVRRTFIDDVVSPFVMDAMSGILHDGVDLLIPGNKSRRSRRAVRDLFSNQKTRYDKIRSSLSGTLSRRSYEDDDEDEVEVLDDDLFVFETRAKAERVYNAMDDALELYRVVSVADIYEMAGITNAKADFTKRNWGWTSMEGVKIRRYGRKWLMDMPEATDIRDKR